MISSFPTRIGSEIVEAMAVLICLHPTRGLILLLHERADKLSDGSFIQLGFGGRSEPVDNGNVVNTALRELSEESGMKMADIQRLEGIGYYLQVTPADKRPADLQHLGPKRMLLLFYALQPDQLESLINTFTPNSEVKRLTITTISEVEGIVPYQERVILPIVLDVLARIKECRA